jgi:hypothetical protein
VAEKEIPLFGGEFDQAAMLEAAAAAEKAKAEADATRDYVLENFRRLMNREIPVEILSVQNLPSHNCLIVNDLLLLSYREAEAILRSLP